MPVFNGLAHCKGLRFLCDLHHKTRLWPDFHRHLARLWHDSCAIFDALALSKPAKRGKRHGMEHHDTLDATGLLCPLPVLKARKRLQGLASGEVLRVFADDPAAIVDVPHFCTEAGHDLIQSDTDAKIYVFHIRKH